MQTERLQPHTLVRRYKGKHAAEHFRRHAAYMAKRGWAVMGTADWQEQGFVVTYACRSVPALASGAEVDTRTEHGG
jgi:hypothetical protein